MPFKVRGKLIGFMNDVDRFPCHFDYKMGEEFTYDGERIEGRINHECTTEGETGNRPETRRG